MKRILASDNFDRANGGLGTNWTTVTGLAAPQITSNTVNPLAVGSDSAAFYNAVSFPNDQWSQATMVAAATSQGIEILCRCAAAAKTFYYGQVTGPVGATAKAYLKKWVAGTLTSLVGPTTFTSAANDVFRLEVIGTSLVLYQNDVALISTTDSSIASGSPGIYVYADAGVITTIDLDLWSGGDFYAPAILKYGLNSGIDPCIYS